MRTIAQAMLERIDDQIAFHVGHGTAHEILNRTFCRGPTFGTPRHAGVKCATRPAAVGKHDGFRIDPVIAGQQNGTMHCVFKFADIPRPRIFAQQSLRFFIYRFYRYSVGNRIFLYEVFAQRGDVAGALAQGRELEADDVEAEEQVFPKRALCDLCFKIAVARGE